MNVNEIGEVVTVTSAVRPNTTLPVVAVQTPVALTAGLLRATSGRLVFDGVVLPVRPVRVMIGRPPGLSAAFALQPTSSGTEGWIWTVMTLGEQGHGLLWLAVATLQTRLFIFNGAASPAPKAGFKVPREKGGACHDGAT